MLRELFPRFLGLAIALLASALGLLPTAHSETASRTQVSSPAIVETTVGARADRPTASCEDAPLPSNQVSLEDYPPGPLTPSACTDSHETLASR
jgi:hypothetical protein